MFFVEDMGRISFSAPIAIGSNATPIKKGWSNVSRTNTKQPSVKTTVLNGATESSLYGETTVRLTANDYDRLLRALDREEDLRRVAYKFVNGGVLPMTVGEVRGWSDEFELALGKKVSSEVFLDHAERIVNAPTTNEYKVERLKKLLERSK